MSIADRVRVLNVQVLSDDWAILKKTTYAYRRNDGTWQQQSRETYDRGNGATILLFDVVRRTVVLTRQFRLPVFVMATTAYLSRPQRACSMRTARRRASVASWRKRQAFACAMRAKFLRPT
jgi:hypothetical protein